MCILRDLLGSILQSVSGGEMPLLATNSKRVPLGFSIEASIGDA
jgi:hypothetical protein